MMLQSKPQLRRQGKPKAKTGCLTCKTRRVKCDEVKPQCRRCVSSGLDCRGYAPSTFAKKGGASTHVVLKPRPLQAIIRTLDTQLSANPEERRYFYLYCQNTAAILSGYFHSDFWSRLVPQIGRDSAPIRHAVAAVSALHKSLETTSRSPLRIDVQKQRDGQYQFALRQYNKAVLTLRQLLSTNGSHYRTALIASLIFISIETLQGDIATAFTHIIGASSLAAEASGYLKSSWKVSGSHFLLDDELVQMFNCLEVQSKLALFDPTKGMASIPSATPQPQVPTIPSYFATTNAAKSSLNSILHYIDRAHSQNTHILEKKAIVSKNNHALLNQWEIAFCPLLQNAEALFSGLQSLPADDKDYIPHFILASTHALAVIILTTNAGRCSEMLYDRLTLQFQRIVDYSKRVIDAMCSSPMTRYVFEVGVLPPLHVAASKCRVPGLRREAIKLLRKCPIQEGIWEGYGCAEACEWVMGIEEGGYADGVQECGDIGRDEVDLIPEWNRVKLSSVVCWLHERRIWAQCASVLPVMHGSHRVWERTFTW